jgi:hypothetical protein
MVIWLQVCSHCWRNFGLKVSDDVGFYFHWVDDCYVFDVVLLSYDARLLPILYREPFYPFF